ncbi:hypothetical protein [Methylotenera mobilis]|uniref:RcnB family protein n=1 Tax=Methylotenera mobilis (strain JLW8 / ATCC BAA-1282 / DSM 17540) TaxID=583345 RepID=C6WWJ6_METML|nr:hypothetical protein [Methylotenera mobilis]ACT48295.1 conserved hypothetical protein [Methylotenera mobilis JLW8]
MKVSVLKLSDALNILLLGVVLSVAVLHPQPAFARKQSQSYEEQDRDYGDDRYERRDRGYNDGRDTNVSVSLRFGDRQRTVVHDYYDGNRRSGFCPPGLAKKHNGCMPPGQAKKWRVGSPLPRDVVYYDLPPRLVVELGVPPAGHRYVRVAADILLIAVGTGMVIDAIDDLGD